MSAAASRRINISKSDFISLTASSFIIISIILTIIHYIKGSADYHFILRGSILRDLISGLPIGRQALVSSLNLMPMSSLAALPFVPFLSAQAYGYAVLYADSMLLCFCALPIANMLSEKYVKLPRLFSILILTFSAAALSCTGNSNLIAAFASFVLALYFTNHSNSALRAISGVFWGTLLFSNIAGIAVTTLFCIYRIFKRLFLKIDAETKAVGWIQMLTIIYIAGIYLFLNSMIMKNPFYSTVKTKLSVNTSNYEKAAADIEKTINEKYSDYSPIVSGNWGYLIEPLLQKHKGHHFIDFVPSKIPGWEKRPLLLIVPTENNPFATLNDIPVSEKTPPDLPNTLLLSKDSRWYFYLIEKK